MLGLVWRASKRWTAAWGILLVIQGLLPATAIHFTRILVDNLVLAIGAGITPDSIALVAIPSLIIAATLLFTEFLRGVGEWLHTAQAELVQDYISTLIHDKSITVDLAFYESPEYYDHLERARTDAKGRSLALLENGGRLLQSCITLCSMGALLIPYGVGLPAVLLISTMPAFYVMLRFNWYHHQWWHATTPDRRKIFYYDWLLTSGDVAAEIRLFNLGPRFQSIFQATRHRLRVQQIKLVRSKALAQIISGLAAIVISGVAIGWMGWQILHGLVTLGDLTLFYQVFNRGQTVLSSVLGNLGQIYSNSLFLENLFKFLQLEPQIADPVCPVPTASRPNQEICFRHVTFCYPGSQRAALQNYNLTIPAEQIVAIVGANGAGKSTLIKLLCRLYDPQQGHIEIDGIDIRNLRVEDYRRLITVLFQFPITYHMSAAQNISLGDQNSPEDRAKIEAAAHGAGAHEFITRLPQGYDSLLGKWFTNGSELSGGEWQKICLARAFFRKAPIMILDEPTSFMDSWAEAEWLARFRSLVKGRTAIIITHRFTTAMQADIIHVMDQGQIIESGSHAELMAQNGRYAGSWQAQMRAGREAAADLARPEAAALNPASANGSGPYSFVKVSPDQPTGSTR